jgi:hypothetical protein
VTLDISGKAFIRGEGGYLFERLMFGGFVGMTGGPMAEFAVGLVTEIRLTGRAR